MKWQPWNVIPNKIRFLLALLVFYYGGVQVRSQVSNSTGYLIDQRALWVAVVEDPALVKFIADDIYIDPAEIERIELFDLDKNGFAKGDIIKTYPDEIVYFLDDPSENLQNVINSWQFQANYSMIGENSEKLSEELEARPYRKAGNAITASLVRGLNRNYQDLPVKIWFYRDLTGFRFEMWSYDEDKLKFQPLPPVVTMPDTVTTYDLLHLFRADTLVIADTTFYDFLYIYKTVSDTVFLPKK